MYKVLTQSLYYVTTIKNFVNKKTMLISAIMGVGIILSAIVSAAPNRYLWAQQEMVTNNNSSTHYGIPNINGSISVKEQMKNFFKENTKIPFITAAETALKQFQNGTVLGGHLGITQGYLTYTFFLVDQTNETGHKVIVDAGNGKVLFTSEGL